MNIEFITGPSGSGKTDFLVKRLIRESIENKEGRYFLVVPEQSTLQTQKRIVENHPYGGTFNIDIVSFNRLAYRVFEELGIVLPPMIDDTGKNLILRKVIEEHKREFKIIKVKDSQGFVSEIKSVISELMQYSVTFDMLSGTMEAIKSGRINGNERIRLKLHDIMIIYKAFKEYIEGKFMTTEAVTDILCRYVGNSKILEGSTVAFDGFTGFTPVQYRLIELLMGKASAIYLTAALGEKDNKCDLFNMSYDMLGRIGRLADLNHVLTNTVFLSDNRRFKADSALLHLERNIFRDGNKYEKNTGEIGFYSALGRQNEIEYVVASVLSDVKNHNMRYKDIAIIAGDMEGYRDIIANTLKCHDIPAFMDNKRSILSNPAVEYIRAALSVVEKDYSYESVFRLLKCHMCSMDRNDVDLMENYCLALGIRGRKCYSEKFFRKYPSRREMSLDKINSVREEILGMTSKLWEVFKVKDSTVGDYVDALLDFLSEQKVEEKMLALKERMLKLKDATKAKEYEQSYAKITALLNQVKELLGDEHMNIAGFADVLDSGFNEIKVGIIPPTIDMLTVGDVERTRLDNVKAVYIVGANEGSLPSANSNKGLFTEYEREILALADLELSPTVREKAYMQNFYLYLNLTKPSEKLVLTYNREERPSKLVGDLVSMFPMADFHTDEDMPREFFINSRSDAVNAFVTEKDGKCRKMLQNVISTDKLWRDILSHVMDAVTRTVTDEDITLSAVKALYGDNKSVTVSKIEQYASCAFSYFAEYGLSLEPRKLYEIGADDLGTIFHEALRLYSKDISDKGYTFATVPQTEREKHIDDAVDRAMTDINNSVFHDSNRNEYMRKRIEQLMRRTVWALGEQIKAGSFIPKDFEKEFVFESGKMTIRGKIDRVDYAEDSGRTYVKVIDYKSGTKKIDFGKLYDGLNLQLMVYLDSLTKDRIPAAAVYYKLDDPIVDYTEKDSFWKADDDSVLEELRPSGIVNCEQPSLMLLDKVTQNGKSIYAPFEYKKDGTLKQSSVAGTESQLRLLCTYASEKMKKLGEEIYDGRVKANPYRESCKYCPYDLVCGFDETKNNNRYRTGTSLKCNSEGYEMFARTIGKGEKEDGENLD